MNRSKSLLILIPFLVGGIQTAKSEVIVPANTTLNHGNIVTLTNNGGSYTFTQDFNCSTSNTYYTTSSASTATAIWACIDALSDSVGSSSGGTDSATTTSINTNTSNITTNKNNINNLGEGVTNATALTAALTALPQASTDSKFSCGIGTGAYSSSYALGVGCASKVNKKVDLNFGGSYVGGGSKDYGKGSLDNVALKAGFLFKLGKINKPIDISMKDKKAMQDKITDLSTANQELQAKVESFELKEAALVARLERIEQIALANQKDEKIAFSFLNVSNLFSSMRSFLISSN